MKTPAFTLVELLVVITIIGILATISIATFSDFKDKAYHVKLVAESAQTEKEIMESAISTGEQFYLVAYDFDNVGGNQIIDTSNERQAFNFTPSASVNIVGDDFLAGSGSIEFTGGALRIPIAIPTVNKAAFSALVKWTDLPSSSANSIHIERKQSTGGDRLALAVYRTSEIGAVVYTSDGDGYVTGRAPIELDKWYHVVTSYNGNNLELYVNNKLISSVPVAETLSFTDSQDLVFGWSNYFSGKVDRLRVFPGAYSPK